MKSNPWKVTTLVLTLALAVAIGLPLVRSADAHKIPQPHMRAALIATKTALRQANKAVPNKGGHRAAAIVLLKKAEAQLVKGVEHAGKHKH